MSSKTQTITIFPLTGDIKNLPEVLSVEGLECPSCAGKGYHDRSGYMQKFKANYDDPDYAECNRCKGTGLLQAKIAIKWEAMPGDSKCPKQE